MATLTLTPSQQGKSLQQTAIRQKKKAVKSVLINPFQTHWPKLPDEDQQKILEDLKCLLLPIYHEKKEMNQESKQTAMEDIAKRKDMQSQYVIGLNSVTRHLEKNLLSLVLVCGSASPKHITKHIAELSAIRGCPAILLKKLGPTLASSLNIKSCITIGFKKPTDGKGFFKEFISSVKAPEISVPFMTNYVAQHSNVLAEVNANPSRVSKAEIPSGKLKAPSKVSVSKDESMELCPASSLPSSCHTGGHISSTTTTTTTANNGFSRFYVRKSANEPVKDSGQKTFDPSINFILLGGDTDDDDDEADDGDNGEALKMMLCFRNRDSNIKSTKWEEIFVPKFMPDHLWGKCENVTKKDEEGKKHHGKEGNNNNKKGEEELSKKDKMTKQKKLKGKNKSKNKGVAKKDLCSIEYKDTSIRRIKGNSDRKLKKSKKDSKKTLGIRKESKTVEKTKKKKNKDIKK